MLSDQLNRTQRVAMRRFNGVDLERNIGHPRQHAILRQRSLHLFDITDVRIQLREMICDSVTNKLMSGSAVRRRLTPQARLRHLQGVLPTVGNKRGA